MTTTEQALYLLEMFDVNDAPTLTKIKIKSLGLQSIVYDPNMHADTYGHIDFTQKKIYVNARHSEEKQFFTIAHEIGNWILYKKYYQENPSLYKVFSKSTNITTAEEEELYTFASVLLVPDYLLDQYIEDYYIDDLVHVFKASLGLIRNRMRLKNKEQK